MICMQRSAHSCEICVELLAGISVLEYAFCTRHNSPLSIIKGSYYKALGNLQKRSQLYVLNIKPYIENIGNLQKDGFGSEWYVSLEPSWSR